MSRRRHINADPRGRGKRLLAVLADIVRWPFERIAWGVERHLLWPLRERTAGWAPSRGAIVAAGLGLAAVAAVAVGALALGGEDEPPAQVAEPASVALAPPAPQPAAEPDEPTLKGAPPSFDVGKGVGVAEAPNAAKSGGEDEDASESEAATASDATAQPGAEAAATASTSKPVPAGPVAMKTARRFAEAFVFYEIGERPERAKTVFSETATSQLAEALGERPPRQPSTTEVPQARVVNLVPGPRENGAYTVSVSLLRLGLTSELRLEMRKQAGTWVVTDVRG